MHSFLIPLLGGGLIGLGALSLLLFNGRVAGISGVVGSLLSPASPDTGWRLAFLAGLILAGLGMAQVMPEAFVNPVARSTGALIAAGLLVGFGTRLGNGCTSGHGVCGIGRISRRSLTATITFIGAGAVCAGVVNRLLGGVL
jgi:uncharacterized protein